MNPRQFVPVADWARVHGRPMRVAILKRRSKDDPDTKSLQVQHDAILRWLNTLAPGSWTCDMRPSQQGGDVYEQIVSGWKGNGQHRLLKQILARLSDYDIVVVYRIDRFGRRVLAVLDALEEMKAADVRLFSVEEGLDTADPAQQFNTGLFALLAQQSSDLTSQRIKDNKQRAKDLGGWRGGAITYGYRKAMKPNADGELMPVLDRHGYKTLQHDPEQVNQLRRAVAWIVDEGWSMAKVVREFNADGVLSPRGYRTLPDGTKERVLWTTTGLKRILANPALKGYDVVGTGSERFQIHWVDGRPHRPHPPIVSDERWQALQAALAPRGGKRRPAEEALLAGLVRCHGRRANGELCGRPMYGPGRVTADNAVYACRSSGNRGMTDEQRCTGNSISAKNLHLLVELLVRGIVTDARWPAAFEAACAARCAQAPVLGCDVESELAQIDARMADLRAEERKAKSRMRRAQIAREIDELDDRVAVLEQTAPPQPGRPALVIPVLEQWEGLSTPERRTLLTSLIERVEILPFVVKGERGRAFDPSRVRIDIRDVGTFHITQPVRPAQVSCPECGKSFAEGSALAVHRRHKHGIPGVGSRAGGRTAYTCPEDGCDRSTSSAGGMKRHVAAVHGSGDVLPCPRSCGKVLRSAQDLELSPR